VQGVVGVTWHGDKGEREMRTKWVVVPAIGTNVQERDPIKFDERGMGGRRWCREGENWDVDVKRRAG